MNITNISGANLPLWLNTAVYLSIMYFMFVNSIYMALVFAASLALRKQSLLAPLLGDLRTGFRSLAPSISILAPAYNEEATIVEAVKSFLSLEYPSFEIIVVNDGSKDKTLQRLIDSFALARVPFSNRAGLSTSEVRGVYKSRIHTHLYVVDKVNGGKADALNCGIGFANHDIFCCVDSDSILENDALMKVAAPFLAKPGHTIASGGTVRIANGAVISHGRVQSVKLPANYFVLMQIIEYTRAFLCGRIGWNAINSTLVISGAFGLFSKKAVIAVGGYAAKSIGEDMELVIRLHNFHRRNKIPYSISFVPDPVCWTEAPTDMNSLQKQRDRWQRGLADSLSRNRRMILNPRYGALGLIGMPYFFFVELLGPVFEFVSYLFVFSALILGTASREMVLTFFMASVLYGALMSVLALLVEEVYFSKYGKATQFLALIVVALVESLGYRQLTTLWRLQGLTKYARGDNTWGQQKRVGFKS